MDEAFLNHVAAEFLHGEAYIFPFELSSKFGWGTWILHLYSILNNIISGRWQINESVTLMDKFSVTKQLDQDAK